VSFIMRLLGHGSEPAAPAIAPAPRTTSPIADLDARLSVDGFDDPRLGLGITERLHDPAPIPHLSVSPAADEGPQRGDVPVFTPRPTRALASPDPFAIAPDAPPRGPVAAPVPPASAVLPPEPTREVPPSLDHRQPPIARPAAPPPIVQAEHRRATERGTDEPEILPDRDRRPPLTTIRAREPATPRDPDAAEPAGDGLRPRVADPAPAPAAPVDRNDPRTAEPVAVPLLDAATPASARSPIADMPWRAPEPEPRAPEVATPPAPAPATPDATPAPALPSPAPPSATGPETAASVSVIGSLGHARAHSRFALRWK
jgi:hypothetical protein